MLARPSVRLVLRSAAVAALVSVALLASAGSASAEMCNALSGTTDWNNHLTWDCGHVPTSADSALIGAGDDVGVSSTPIAAPALVALGGGRIVVSSDKTLTTEDFSVSSGAVAGAGTMVVEGDFSKGTVGTFAVTNHGGGGPAPDLILNGDGTFGGGSFCVGRDDDANPDEPNLNINGELRLVDEEPNEHVMPFNCTSGPHILVGPTGQFVSERNELTRIGTMIVNDGAARSSPASSSSGAESEAR
jgi:hypothetical protein